MGRIIFLTAVAFAAYRYISKSNQRHQAIAPGDNNEGSLEVLPAAPATTTPAIRGSATESAAQHQKLLATSTSKAAEPDPVR
ncbi:MAG TPA: hypothetical protein VER03_18780 [Bryobacteraceae bacterium]|nr:hypothetical protein [Bryobacteraceae bacterium]